MLNSEIDAEFQDDLKGRPVVEVSVGKTHSFGDGALSITLDYELRTGEDKDLLVIWHFVSDGDFEKLPCTYDAAKKTVTFDAGRLSKFAIMENKYDVIIDTNANGTVTVTPDDGKSIAPGTSVTVTVTPDDGYFLKDQSLDPDLVTESIPTVGGTYTFTMPDEDVTFSFTFAALEPADDTSDDGDDGGFPIGIAIGAVVAVLAVIVIAVFLMKRKA